MMWWPHYKVIAMKSMDDVREVFPSLDNVDELNLLITGTSGVHGSYTQAHELEFRKYISNSDEPGLPGSSETDGVTVLIIHTRLVVLRYGEIPVTKADAEYLVQLQHRSVQVFAETYGPKHASV